MSFYIIDGGRKLEGKVTVHGAKNAALPILAATLLSKDHSVIENCPSLTDIDAAMDILRHLGCDVERDAAAVTVDSKNADGYAIPDDLMSEMRSSIVFLGAIISRTGRARLSYPGGCELGQRPIDLHLAALRKMGVVIEEEHGFLNCRAEKRLSGADIALSFPSVGATENIMLAACLAKGATVITNAACEPEIVDLADYLNRCGASIAGAGERSIRITGVEKLGSARHRVIPDRIEAATYLCAAAAAGGDVTLVDINCSHLSMVLPIFAEAGCRVTAGEGTVRVKAPETLQSAGIIRTMPYPGFPTDAQAPLMAMLAKASGNTIFIENIFENRYKHVTELVKMGADIKVEGRMAVVNGRKTLNGSKVYCTDLRGGAALVVAGLSADGVSQVMDLRHIDRGYENFDGNLRSLGAEITRCEAPNWT